MRAAWVSCGLDISLGKEDAVLLQSGRQVECDSVRNSDDGTTKIILRIAPTAEKDSYQLKFPWYEERKGALLEPGWHIDTFPDESIRHQNYSHLPPDERPLSVYIPLERFRVTITPQVWDQIYNFGGATTRSIYDRVDIGYWEEGMVIHGDGWARPEAIRQLKKQ